MTDTDLNKPRNALILLGCPQVPVQTSIALWLCAALNRRNIPCLVGGTPAARSLLEVADPDHHYLTEVADLDTVIEELAGGTRTVDAAFVLVHNTAAVAYAATMQEIAGGTTYALLFGEETETRMADLEGVGCRVIAAKGSHNPLPLKRRVQEVLDTWDA
ncbi:hypothetical protein AZH53_03720 [Methanomicrobiaceae archaeon CYW5]|uniref:DUF1890 domain-containing protein n=1 Tax=Methanovulcanius yangii TaxID=1789227 RepID=UPI0029CA8B6D|nr:DUF1890 domain-containing protein [Methanovulcanius yangii]MBT8507530.1 hypothetical protein [Methanovulcanius yangii]